MSRRRENASFNLSFLDIMSCGLGAAVLLFLILKHNANQPEVVPTENSSEINLLSEEVRVGQEHLARILNTLSEVDDELAEARGLADRIQQEIDALRGQIASSEVVSDEDINSLRSRIEQLEALQQSIQRQSGQQVRQFIGQGQRQYLTGVKLGGDRILIMVDSSASMTDAALIDIIRRKVSSEQVRRDAPKWQRTLAIVDWLTANLPPESQFQLMAFSDEVTFLSDQTRWRTASDTDALDFAVSQLNNLVPSGGTNLFKAVEAANTLRPSPDNIFLLTDGLPTLGERANNKTSISGNERLELFNQATEGFRRQTPVNIMLLPLEGDPLAAAAYWQLAQLTKGSFITPAEDWP